MFKQTLTLSLIITLALGLASQSAFADETSSQGRRAAEYLLSRQTENGAIGSVGFTSWAIQALAANGLSTTRAADFLISNLGDLENSSATDLERTILAVTAAGRNPYNVGGKNLVTLLKSKAVDGQLGSTSLLNDDLFGILALIAADLPSDDPVLRDTVAFVTRHQQGNGSWSWSTSGGGESNSTAIAVTALELARTKGISVDWNKQKAINFLKDTQKNSGGFAYTADQAADAASTSWVVSAIIALGQEPESWLKHSKQPYDYLSSLQVANGGVKWQNDEPEPDILTSSYAAIAFARQSIPVARYTITPTPTPTLSPTPQLTPSPSPTLLPTPTPTPTPSSSPSVAPTPSPRVSPRLTPSPSLSPSPRPTPSERVTPQSSPTPSTSPAPSPTPSASSQVSSPSPTPSPTPTVSAASNNSPTAAPTTTTLNQVSQEDDALEISDEEDAEVTVKQPSPKTIFKLPTLFTKKTPATREASPEPSPTSSANTASQAESSVQIVDDGSVLGTTTDNQSGSGNLIGAGVLVLTGIILVAWGGARTWLVRRL